VEAVTPAGIGLWALVALAQTGPAVSVPVRVEFDAPAGCSDAEAFFAGVLSRTRHVHRAHPGETAVRLTVHVTRAGARVHGELRVNGAGDEAETRRVDGATCAEVVQVLSLTAALAIDPTADLLAPAAPEKPTATPPPVRATPSAPAAPPPRAAPAASPAPAVASPPPPTSTSPTAPSGAPPAQVVTPPASAPPERPPPAGPASLPAPPPTVALAPPPATIVAEPRPEPPRPSGPGFGASVVAARVLASSLGLGASLWGRFGITTRGGLTPSVTLAALYLPGDFFGSGDNLGISWMALAATGCPGWAPGGRVRVEPCARITAGILSATDHSVNTPRSVVRWWGSAGALVRLTAPLGGGLTLDLDAGVDFPFVTRRFIISTATMTNQPVGATTSVSPTLSVGLSHGL
jgi:hypothetical protein